MEKQRYEAKELNGEADKIVRKWNTHIPKEHPIYGIWDNLENRFVNEGLGSTTGYFWTCVKETAEHCTNHLNLKEVKE